MFEVSIARCGPQVLVLLLASGCFDGRDALGLPCRSDDQCGRGQQCVDDVCRWPSEVGESQETTGPTDTETETEAETDSQPGPLQLCAPGTPPLDDPMFSARSLLFDTDPMAVGVGDFIGRGPETIAVVSRSEPARVRLFRGFEELPGAIEVESGPMDLATGDLDGDGFTDIVISFEPADGVDLRVLWGSTSGLVKAPASTFDFAQGIAYSVAVGDLVEGGRLEIVAAIGDQTASAMLLHVQEDRSLGMESLTPGVSSSPWDAITVDLDESPPSEVLIAGSNDGAFDFPGSDEVRIFAAPTGAISEFTGTARLPRFLSPYGVDVGDLDGDGLLDIVVVGKNIEREDVTEEESDLPSEVSVCVQRPGLTFDCESRLEPEGVSGFSNVRLGDFDCDGDLDAFIGTSGTTADGDGAVRVIWGPVTVDTPSQLIEAVGPIGNRMVVSDIDEDGRPEVVVPMMGEVRVYDAGGGS